MQVNNEHLIELLQSILANEWSNTTEEQDFAISTVIEIIKNIEEHNEEVGCPLDVIIKATRNGIYATRRKWDGIDKIEVFEKFDVTFDGYSLWNEDEYPYNYDEIFKISPICNEFRIYDYKKSWWLKEDRSE